MNMKINRNNIQLVLIVCLMVVVTYFIIFDKDNGKGLRTDSENRVEKLEEELKQIQKDKLSIIDSLNYYHEKEKEWDSVDSLRSIELKEAEEKYLFALADKKKAERERIEALNKLEVFKENPPKINDSINLIWDTKNRLIE